MLFNSLEFIFFFWPIALLVFFAVGSQSVALARVWLIVVSIAFYASWRPINVAIVAPSIVVNYFLARALMGLRDAKQGQRTAKWVLVLGIAFNLAFLGYFKYFGFLSVVANDVAGTHFVLTELVLPLGISFITFQKIAFLVDVHARRVETFRLQDYVLFVLFFPQLIAGPIVHYREMMPQFQAASCRFNRMNVSVGLTLFVLGLFKKVVLADGIAEHVTPIYDMASKGAPVSLIPAWIAALGFTLQIYFDFSGYSDMAIGIARCFGITLPANFYSPLQSRSVIDFWWRWHMTLTRFLTAYLYNPVALAVTRWRMSKGLKGLNARRVGAGAFLHVLAVPTILTMFVSGLWHGAGYTFIIWGVMHGAYLVVNHLWRYVALPRVQDSEKLKRVMWHGGLALTLLAVVFSMVLFRASSLAAAGEVLSGMVGANGVRLPQIVVEKLQGLLGRPMWGITASTEFSGKGFAMAIAWTTSLLAIVLAAPNSLQITSRFDPALLPGGLPREGSGWLPQRLLWSPTRSWGIVVAILAVWAIGRVGGTSEFLYWQF